MPLTRSLVRGNSLFKDAFNSNMIEPSAQPETNFLPDWLAESGHGKQNMGESPSSRADSAMVKLLTKEHATVSDVASIVCDAVPERLNVTACSSRVPTVVCVLARAALWAGLWAGCAVSECSIAEVNEADGGDEVREAAAALRAIPTTTGFLFAVLREKARQTDSFGRAIDCQSPRFLRSETRPTSDWCCGQLPASRGRWRPATGAAASSPRHAAGGASSDWCCGQLPTSRGRWRLRHGGTILDGLHEPCVGAAGRAALAAPLLQERLEQRQQQGDRSGREAFASAGTASGPLGKRPRPEQL